MSYLNPDSYVLIYIGFPHLIQLTAPNRQNRQINAFDVAPDLSQIALGFNDGSIHRLPLSLHTRTQLQNGARNASTTPQAKRVTYRAHVATITSLRYFPSSRVLLAASADFSLTILDAEISPTSSTQNGELRPVRTLKGHSRSVTDASIISRGRNVLSCAKDGTVRLWDVGGGSQIRMMNVKNFSGVNAISVGTSADGGISDDGEALMDEREVETEDKVVYCALQNGAFEAIDLRTKRSTYNSLDSMSGSGASTRSSLTSIALSSTTQLLATGTSRGVISLYDTRSLCSTLASWRRNESPIESIAFLPSSNELAVATEDGLPYIADISSPNRDVIGVGAELVGGNCEAVRCLRINGGGVWTADEEGIVRTY